MSKLKANISGSQDITHSSLKRLIHYILKTAIVSQRTIDVLLLSNRKSIGEKKFG